MPGTGGAAVVTCQIVIPVQPPGEGKSRLASVLDAPARAALVERMFRHVLAVAVDSVPPSQVRVVSRSTDLLSIAEESGALMVREQSRGLNPALEHAAALCDPDLPLLALSADLPLLDPADIAALVGALDHADVIAAADHSGKGTNALLLRRPGLIAFAFGKGSLACHRALAEQTGHRFEVVQRPGLASDIDEPTDLALLEP
jgi:2-phospho-L-lactate/phosphoenolpyruvate guanylyltransferase